MAEEVGFVDTLLQVLQCSVQSETTETKCSLCSLESKADVYTGVSECLPVQIV